MSNESKVRMSEYIKNVWASPEMAEHWQRGAEMRQQAMAKATQRMLDAAELKPGDHVLDIAAGTGDQGRLAAHRIAPGGSVLITDLSAEMLSIAARLAEQEGLTSVTTRVMNAEQLELEDNTFDVVICRYGLEAVPDLPKALLEIYRVLKPGGKLSALTQSVAERNPLVSFFAASSSKQAHAASTSIPTPFAYAEATIFAQAFKDAGFNNVATETVPFEFRYPSLEALLQSSRREIGAGGTKYSPQDQQQRLEEMKRVFSKFEGSDGLVLPGEALLGVGTK